MHLLLLALFACDGGKNEDTGPAPADDSGTPADTGTADADGDGWTVADGDCDDHDEYTNPDAGDVPYDGKDQDCDGADVNDWDGDGYVGEQAGGDDCDDNNATAHPGGTEVCYNYVDEDCNGDPDDDYDCDNDGYVLADDCDDTDAGKSPDATDAWYDGDDTNCDGLDDYDQDLDGEESDAYGGTDCDDLDPTLNTAASETWDGTDEDCSGVPDDLGSWDATSTWNGDYGLLEAGFATALLTRDDLTGDGVRDVLVGVPGTQDSDGNVPGRVYLLPWGEGLGIPGDDALGSIEGEATKELGYAIVEAPDGRVAVGGPDRYAGESGVYLFDADDIADGMALTVGDATLAVEFVLAGGDVVPWGDDLIVANAFYDGWGTQVYRFPITGATGTMSETDATWSYTSDGDVIDVANIGDADGDGLDEVAVAAYVLETYPRVLVINGADVEAGATADGLEAINGFTDGVTLSGADVDGDGYSQLLASDLDGDSGDGVVYVADAADSGAIADIATATVTGDVTGGRLRVTAGLADLDGDGTDDLLVCSPGDGASSLKGVCSPVSSADLAAGGDHAPGGAAFSVTSDERDTLIGSAVSVEDADGDGDLDVWLGASGSEGELLYFRQD